jgi:hypothetical protein
MMKAGVIGVGWWPYYAPNPLRGGASKGARDGRILEIKIFIGSFHGFRIER